MGGVNTNIPINDGVLQHYDTQKHEKVTQGGLPIDAFIFDRIKGYFGPTIHKCSIFWTGSSYAMYFP